MSLKDARDLAIGVLALMALCLVIIFGMGSL